MSNATKEAHATIAEARIGEHPVGSAGQMRKPLTNINQHRSEQPEI